MTKTGLPAFGDRYQQVFDSQTKSLQIRKKGTAEGNLDIPDLMDLVYLLLQRYETTYWVHQFNKNMIQMPFLFQEPEEGDRIRNATTNEIYTVDQVLRDRDGRWKGHLRLDLENPPSYENRHSLCFVNPEKHVRFVHEFTPTPPNEIGTNTEGNFSSPPPIWPTVSWSLVRREPGALNGPPFSPGKEFKPRLRDTVKDPLVQGYTVEIYGQWFDNVVQFDCWSHDTSTSSRLAYWLESFFKYYAGFLRRRGLAQVFFWQRVRDEIDVAWRQAVHVNSSQFFFRTEQLDACYQRDVLKIDINIDVASTANRDPGLRYIADQLVSGQLTGQQYLDLFYRSGEYLFGEVDIFQ